MIDIAPHPDAVHVPADLPPALMRLERALGGALAVVSGRSLAVIDRLLAPWRPVAAGEHGAECRLPDGIVMQPPSAEVPAEWRDSLTVLASAMPGVVIENKRSAITLHYRQAPACRNRLLDAAERLVMSRPDGFAVTPAHMAIEIRPRGIDKGGVVKLLMREPLFLSRVPVFVGDDVTDEDGIRAAEELGGWGLHVSDYFPRGAAGVRDWIVSIADQLGETGRP